MEDGKVKIHNKEYKTVALRVNEFRDAHPEYSIVTDLIDNPGPYFIMKASILNEDGRVIATGWAEEFREASKINRTSALENCETSAVGRALAFFGLAGSEIASADEVANAINQQNTHPAMITEEQKKTLTMFAAYLTDIEPDNSEKIRSNMNNWTYTEAYAWIEGIKKAHPEYRV